MIQDSKAVTNGDKQPVDTAERSVIEHSGSLYVNVTGFAERLHGVEVGDTVNVHITHAGLVVDLQPTTEDDP
jgi:predicted RNA-binding protein with TRAM domain